MIIFFKYFCPNNAHAWFSTQNFKNDKFSDISLKYIADIDISLMKFPNQWERLEISRPCLYKYVDIEIDSNVQQGTSKANVAFYVIVSI